MSVLFVTKIGSKKDPLFNNRDRFILSKGHACLAYYASLFENKLLDKNDLLTFEKNGSDLLGHPVRNMKKGIEFSTGSWNGSFPGNRSRIIIKKEKIR